MNINLDTIVRIAARGDGVTADGRHAAGAVPGDTLDAAGIVTAGPNRQTPPCRHFGTCGGCQLQHVSETAYADYVHDRVVGALVAQKIEGATVHAAIITPPATRRRAALRAHNAGSTAKPDIQIGFSAAQTNQIVVMSECPMLHPDIFACVAPLRPILAQFLAPKAIAQVKMTLIDQGVDVLIDGIDPKTLAQFEALSGFAQAHSLARLSIDRGDGPEVQWEPEPATITLGQGSHAGLVAVPFPPFSFLQASSEGETVLVAAVVKAVGDAKMVADLFCGAGTFAAALAGQAGRAPKIYAADAARDAILALKSAAYMTGRSIFPDHRDLFRKPLNVAELDRFDAVILDPPRAGAAEQVAQLAQSKVQRIAYVSCNPASFARDARVLLAEGYQLNWVQPVGQFTWSTHIELVASLSR